MIRIVEDINELEFDSKYEVTGGVYSREIAIEETDDPGEAIKIWFQLSKKYPMDAAIFSIKRSDAQDLINWASDHHDMIEKWHRQYKNGYKLDYLLSVIDRDADKGVSGYFDNKWGTSDQVYPFCYG